MSDRVNMTCRMERQIHNMKKYMCMGCIIFPYPISLKTKDKDFTMHMQCNHAGGECFLLVKFLIRPVVIISLFPVTIKMPRVCGRRLLSIIA